MNKDDILAKSRKENKNKDLFEAEVNTNAATISSIVASLLATVFFVVQVLLKDEFNLALYALLFAIGATTFVSRAAYMKRKRDIVLAILYVIATLILTVVHIYQLIVG